MDINPFDILKNFQVIQSQLDEFKNKIGSITVTGSAGAGLLEIDLNGKMEIVDVRISQEIAGDLEMLRDLIISAYADALEKVRAALASGVGVSDINNLTSLLGKM
ncbi:MAG: YbaB/EbfC family nucleoid-associated protein [Spirochaetaceae bacterium]|jgi:DNA-binding YbaB/EbfC family protein|nr:YbaB/EbfC family nucleoid-associated protein [Spirochaetaceae bacterium]